MNSLNKIFVLLLPFFISCAMEFDFSEDGSATRFVAGDGATVPGTGATSVPTPNAIIKRLAMGFPQGFVNPANGNFSTAIGNLRGNLLKVPNPLEATGYDFVAQLTFAACNDVSNTELGTIGINTNNSISSNQTALVNSFMAMLDRHTGGLATQGPVNSQLRTSLDNLMNQIKAVNSNTTRIAFNAGCYAAQTASLTMLGF